MPKTGVMKAPKGERWPTSFSVTLAAHLKTAKFVFSICRQQRLEEPWYWFHNHLLSFFAARRSDDAIQLSVAPQYPLLGELASHDDEEYFDRLLCQSNSNSNVLPLTRNMLHRLDALRAAGLEGTLSNVTSLSSGRGSEELESLLSSLSLSSTASTPRQQDMTQRSSLQTSSVDPGPVEGAGSLDDLDADESFFVTMPDSRARYHCRRPDFVVFAILWDGETPVPVHKILCVVEVKRLPRLTAADSEQPAGEEVFTKHIAQQAFTKIERQAAEQVLFAFEQDTSLQTVCHLSLIANWGAMRWYERQRFENGGYEDAVQAGRFDRLVSRDCQPYKICDASFSLDYSSRFKADWTRAQSEVAQNVKGRD